MAKKKKKTVISTGDGIGREVAESDIRKMKYDPTVQAKSMGAYRTSNQTSEAQKQDRLKEAKARRDNAWKEYNKAAARATASFNKSFKAAGGVDASERFKKTPTERFKTEGKFESTESSLYNEKQKNAKANVKANQSKDYKEKTKEKAEKYNEAKYKEYQYQSAKVDSEKTNLYDKTLGVAVRGLADLTSNLSDNSYYDKKGNKTFLPSYSELKQEKVSKDYKTGVGRFLGDVGYNSAKILAATALDVPTAGIAGKALYWSDMFTDQYKNTQNKLAETGQKQSNVKSIANAAANTALEYVTEKVLGGAANSLTKGVSKATGKAATKGTLSDLISNGVYKITKNSKISSILGTAGSEASEEFVQEYAQNLIDIATVGQDSKGNKGLLESITDKDILSDALYAAAVGAASGAAVGSIQTDQTGRDIRVLNDFRNILEEKRETLTSKEDIEKYTKTINTIDEYLNKPFGDNTNKVSEIANNTINKSDSISANSSITQIAPVYREFLQQNTQTKTAEKTNTAVNVDFNTNPDGNINIVLKDAEGNVINEITVNSENKQEVVAKTGLKSELVDYVMENSTDKIKSVPLNQATPVSTKAKQLETIKRSNPMRDEYHQGIRTIDDIKTFKEAINDPESFVWGDYTKEDALKDLAEGTVTVYSSTPIENGTFVSTSRNQARDYAGNGKIYSKKLSLADVAWINGDEGQYAKITKTIPEAKQQDVLEVKRKNLSKLKLDKSGVKSNTDIARVLDKVQKNEKPKSRAWAIAKSSVIDKGIVFEELDRVLKSRNLQSKYDYMLLATAQAQNAIGNARYEFKNGKQTQVSKSLTDIIDEVGENKADFQDYMYHQLNIDRMTLDERYGEENKPVFGESVTAEESRKKVAEYEKEHPEFKKYAKDVYDFLDANTDQLVKDGVISKETQQLFKEMYPHYVPINRVDAKGNVINVPLDTKRTGINSPIKRAKGGSGDIQPLFETIAARTMQTYKASARNSFGLELRKAIQKMDALNEISEKADIDSVMENMTNEDESLLQKSTPTEPPSLTVFDNGEKVTFEITEDMYDALKPMNEKLRAFNNSNLAKGLQKINTFRRGVLTEYNPFFALFRNPVKDVQDVLLNSQHAAKTYAKIPEAYAQIISKGYWFKEYIQNGGEQDSYFRDGEFDNVKKDFKSKILLPLKAISTVGNVIETAPRLAEYIVSRQNGADVQTAMLDAARVTTNFKAGGDVTKTLNKNGFTFLNASIQGFQQQVRNIQEANAKGLKGYAVLASKYALAAAPAIILNSLIWRDDDDYDELSEYEKDNYYIVGKTKKGEFIKIPKGRVSATIQKIVGNAAEFGESVSDGKINADNFASAFWKDLGEDWESFKNNLAPNSPSENNLLAPIIQAATNKTWYGEDLVPNRLQDLPSKEQYDETTDSFSRWLGDKLNISPKKINYVIDQYSGAIGDVILPKMTPKAEGSIVKDTFIVNPTIKNKKAGEFYEKYGEITTKSKGRDATVKDKLQSSYMNKINAQMSELYEEKRNIQNSKKSDKEKLKEIEVVQKKINKLAKEGVNGVDKVETAKSNYGKIDGKEFYLNTRGTWSTVKEDLSEALDDLELTNNEKNKYFIAKNKISTIKSNDELSSSEKRTKTNNAIANSGLDDYTKAYLHTKGKTDYIVDAGINYNEYLKFNSQNFESDYNEKTGKSISNSKKKKVINYVNSLNLSIPQKAILIKQKYSTFKTYDSQIEKYVNGLNLDFMEKATILKKANFKSYDKQIVNYVESQKMTKEEKIETLKDLGFTVRNGRVYY